MKYLLFKNPGKISYLDLISMGDSDKRGDSTKIGQFDSGLKYALAILFRNNVKVVITSGDTQFTLDTYTLKDSRTGKVKEVLCITECPILDQEKVCHLCKTDHSNEFSFQDGHSICEGCRCEEAALEWKEENSTTHQTGFSPQLGYDWEFWMALREIYSNCLDEKGELEFSNSIDPDPDTTKVYVEYTSAVAEVYSNWNKHFLPSSEILLHTGEEVDIYTNTSLSPFSIYKKKIQIYEKKEKALFLYQVNTADIDERRVLRDSSQMFDVITNEIKNISNKKIIHQLCTLGKDTDYYETNLDFSTWNPFSEEWVTIINSLYQEGKLDLPTNILEEAAQDERINIGIKRIRSSKVFPWETAKVTLVGKNSSKVEKPLEQISFEDRIRGIATKHGYLIQYPIEEAEITGFNVLADTRKKILYVTNDFTSENLWQLIREHMRLESNDSIDYVYKEYVKLLKSRNE